MRQLMSPYRSHLGAAAGTRGRGVTPRRFLDATMAGRKTDKAKSQAKDSQKQAVQRAREAAAAEKGTLVAQEAAKQSGSRRRLREMWGLGRRKTEEQADRALKEHFQGWTEAQVDLILVDGVSLRQRLIDDLHKKKTSVGEKRLSSTCYMELRTAYGGSASTDLQDPFACADDSEEVSASLISALVAARSPNTTQRSKAPVTAFLSSVTAINQRSLCGLCRHMVSARASVSPSSMTLALDFLRCVSRLSLHTRWPLIWQRGLATWADETLCSSLAGMKKSGLDIQVWWDTHCGIAPLLVPFEAAERALGCKTRWVDVLADLSACCASSKIGAKLFSFALVGAAQDRVAIWSDEFLATLKGPVQSTDRDAFFTHVRKNLQDLTSASSLDDKRTIKLSYKSMELTILICGLDDELTIRWQAFVREHSKDLLPLPFEHDLFPNKKGKLEFHKKLLHDAQVCRQTLKQLLEEHAEDPFHIVIKKKQDLLVQGDKGARIDVALAEAIFGEAGEKHLRMKVALQHSKQMLDDLKPSELYKATSTKSQAQLTAAYEAVNGMIAGRPVHARIFEASSMRPILMRLGNFCTWRGEGKDTNSPMFFGAEAMAKHFSLLEASATPTFAELDLFHTFANLLSADQNAKVAEKTKACLAEVQVARKTKRHDTDEEDDDGESAVAKKARIEQAACMALFRGAS